MRASRIVPLVATVALGCERPVYVCATSADCAAPDAPGQCVTADDGRAHCAVLDETCPSHVRFGDTAGAVSGECATRGDGPETRATCLPGLPPPETACRAAVCERAPSCCTSSWQPLCVQLAEVACGISCSGRIALASTNALDVIDWGGPPTARPTYVPPAPYDGRLQKYRGVRWADLDRDGTAELVVGTCDDQALGDHQVLLRPDAAGWAVVQDLVAASGSASCVNEIAIAAYDDTTPLDVVVAGLAPGLELLRGTGAAEPVALDPIMRPAIVRDSYSYAIDVTDLDGDGVDELITTDNRTHTIRIARRGRTDLMLDEPIAAGTAGDLEYHARLGDADGDGQLDLLVSGGGHVRLFSGQARSFRPTPFVFDSPEPFSTDAAWIDFDRDGDLDVVTSYGTSDGGHLWLWRNDAGGFTTDRTDLDRTWTSERKHVAAELAVGDVDGDLDQDIVVAASDGGSVVYLNESTAARTRFTQPPTALLPPSHETFGVALALLSHDWDRVSGRCVGAGACCHT